MTSQRKRSFVLGTLAMASVYATGGMAWGQSTSDWPTRPVNIVVGFGAGGPTDVLARILAENLSAKFKQSFVVENKAGAAGGLAAGAVKQATPDGYTLMFGSSSTLSIVPTLQSSPGVWVLDWPARHVRRHGRSHRDPPIFQETL